MIKEAYVSFEVAKLLKEKGFDELCSHCYFFREFRKLHYYEQNSEVKYLAEAEYCSAPTHQMACAWLREIHKLHIEVWAAYDQGTEELIGWNIIISDLSNLGDVYLSDAGRYKTFEEATEVALKYSLENLI